MPPRHATVAALCIAAAVFAAGYTFVVPGPYYHPIEGVWHMDRLPDTPAMSWYARIGWNLTAAAAVGAVVCLVCLRLPPFPWKTWQIRFATMLPVFALAAAWAWLAYHEWTHWGHGQS